MCEPLKPRNATPARNGFAGILGVPSRSTLGEGLCRRRCLERIDGELPGVGEDGMSGRNGQRKLGTTRGLPRRSRTAKASRISRHAAKSRCACEWGGWGRLSDDGLGQHNPASSEDPQGRWGIPPYGGALSSPRPAQYGITDADHEVHEGRRQTERQSAHAGSRLKLIDVLGRSRLISQPSSRIGENPPYGMRGGTMETAASFEVRNAPSSYPTVSRRQRRPRSVHSDLHGVSIEPRN